MPLDHTAKGVYVIAPTPFHPDGRVDEAGTDRMTDFFLQSGCDGMTILGVMGEAPKLDGAESLEISKRIIRRAGKAGIIVGVTAPGFAAMRALAHGVMEAGAAGVMIAPPSHLRHDEAIIGYFHQAIEAIGSDIPWVLQDYPQLFQVQMTPGIIRRIVTELPSCVMLKHEDWPGLAKLSAVRKGSGTADTPRLSILCGNGGLYLPQEMARGADGAMTGFAYPEMLVGVVSKHLAGDADGAEDLFDAYLPLCKHEQQFGIGLAIRKETLRRRGVIASAKVRAPGPSLSPDDHAELTRLIARTEAKLKALG